MSFSRFLKIKILLIIAIIFTSCSKIDPVTGEKILIEPDPIEKAKKAAAEGKGIFGTFGKDLGKTASGSSSVSFSGSNVLWRATLKSLDFLPLANSDYTGGIIIYDWYSSPNNPKEQIKITVQFLSDDIRSDSVKVSSYKRICDDKNNCVNSVSDKNFSNSIKDTIIESARSLKIEEAKKEKK